MGADDLVPHIPIMPSAPTILEETEILAEIMIPPEILIPGENVISAQPDLPFEREIPSEAKSKKSHQQIQNAKWRDHDIKRRLSVRTLVKLQNAILIHFKRGNI